MQDLWYRRWCSEPVFRKTVYAAQWSILLLQVMNCLDLKWQSLAHYLAKFKDALLVPTGPRGSVTAWATFLHWVFSTLHGIRCINSLWMTNPGHFLILSAVNLIIFPIFFPSKALLEAVLVIFNYFQVVKAWQSMSHDHRWMSHYHDGHVNRGVGDPSKSHPHLWVGLINDRGRSRNGSSSK
jgi:hypothetical protein